MHFLTTDRLSIERGIVVRQPYVVISVRDPGKRAARLRRTVGLRGVLRLAFHDAEPAAGYALPPEIRVMSERDARSVAAFVHKHLADIGAIVCHCEQGMSRSPAIAAALAESLGESAERILAESQPNQYVYRLVLEAMREAVRNRD